MKLQGGLKINFVRIYNKKWHAPRKFSNKKYSTIPQIDNTKKIKILREHRMELY